MKAIVFGINGQDGFYLKQLLENQGITCVGVSRSDGNWTQGDVVNTNFVEALIKQQQPNYVFHLAANSTTRHEALFENHHTISTGTLNVLEAVKNHCPNCRVFISGSAMQFKNNGLPIDENTAFEGSSPYSVSRIQSVYAARYYREKFGIQTYVGYFFNHDSPFRTERHVNQKIVQAALRMAAGSKEVLALGNIEVQKEFTFAGDVAAAIWTLVQQKGVSECVIGSGKAYSIAQWLDICFTQLKLDWHTRVQLHDNFQAEYHILVSNPARIKSLGWTPIIGIEALADMMLNFKN